MIRDNRPGGLDRPVKVAFINTHPIQYFAPLYAFLNRSSDLAITALYLSDYSVRGAPDRSFGRMVQWDIDLLSGYDARFVDGAQQRNEPHGFLSAIASRLWHDVVSGGFDAIIVHGHTPAAMMIAIAAGVHAGTPVFMRAETHLGLARSPLKRALRRPLLGALYARLAGVLAIGSANAAFYRAMGVPDRKTFLMPYAVDNERFACMSHLTEAERVQLRARFGVTDDRPIVLFAAKLQPRKRPDDLLQAAAHLSREGLRFHVVLIGSGQMEQGLRDLRDSLGLGNVHFEGFVNQRSMPASYGACDVFVLPSDDEPWGLAVNEAMCAGLPLVASAAVGCAPDLVHDGINGATFAARDVRGLAQALRPMLESSARRRAMGEASTRIIAGWSFDGCLRGLRAALAHVGLVAPTEPV